MNMSMAAQSCWHCWHCPLSLEYKLKMSYLFKQKEDFFFFEHNSCGLQRLKAPSVSEKITDDDISSSHSLLFKDIKHLTWAQIDMHEPMLDDLFSPEFLLVPPRLLILPLEQEGCLIENPDCVRVGLPPHSHRNQTGFIISKSWIRAESSKAIRPRFGQPLSFSSSPRGSIRTSMSFLDDSMYVLTLYSLFKYTETNTDTDSFQHQHYCNEKQLSCLFLILPNNKLQVQSCVFRTDDLAKQICFLISCD